MGDLRYGFRSLRRNPGFTAVAVLTLALGIGANTSIFSVVYATLLRSPPYPEAERLAVIEPSGVGLWSYPLFEEFRDAPRSFDDLAAFTAWNPTLNLGGVDVPERIAVEFVSANYLDVLGVRPQAGRSFTAEEDAAPGAHPVVVLGHGLWRRKFGSDPAVLGRTIVLNGVSVTVVGIAPPAFSGLSGHAEVWLPMMMAPTFMSPSRLTQRLSFWHSVVIRLRPSAHLGQARAELEGIARAVAERFRLPSQMTLGFELIPLKEWGVDPKIRSPLLILLAAVGFVLLIASVNIANLSLSRAARRTQEIGVRTALGATRRRLVRLLLIESLLLGLVGGAVGLIFAVWGIEALAALKPAGLTAIDLEAIRIGREVLAFNMAVALAAALLSGILPALHSSRVDLGEALREGTRRTLGGALSLRRFSARSALIVAEIALALVLSISAGLMIRSFARARSSDLGFDHTGLLTAELSLPRQQYTPQAASAFFEQLSQRAAGLPGASGAAVANCLPLSGGCDYVILTIEALAGTEEGERPMAVNVVDDRFFEALQIPLLHGRRFAGRDGEGAPRVAIINRSAAERFWPDGDPIGQRVRPSLGWAEGEWAEIVGVVGDARYGELDAEIAPMLYLPLRQFSYLSNFILVETEGPTGELVQPLRAEVRELDADLPLYDVRTMSERIAVAISRLRFSASLLGIFASLAFALALIGVYGVVAFAVSGRTREIGLRMAMGAERGDVVRAVVGESLGVTLVGVSLGVAAALGLTRLLASQLYGVEPIDAATFVSVTLALALAATAAAYLPARRASQVDPVASLRQE